VKEGGKGDESGESHDIGRDLNLVLERPQVEFFKKGEYQIHNLGEGGKKEYET